MSHSINLNGEWRLRAIGESPKAAELSNSVVGANVPGTVHTDLIAAGIIPDPFYLDNESQVQWIEDVDWEYSREFELKEDEIAFSAISLVFEGIDTVADLYLNDRRILHAQNMFVTHRVRIEKHVHTGSNSLRVVLYSPKVFAIKREKKHGAIFAELDSYRVHIRKAQYSFGWDWGPRLATSGIWRGVHIDFIGEVAIEDIHLSTLELRRGGARALFTAKCSPVSPAAMRGKRIRVTVSDAERAQDFYFPAATNVKGEIDLKGVQPWWTHDHGEPKLYGVRVELLNSDGNSHFIREFKTGFRTIRLLRDRDKTGEGFIFELNGIRIFAKGADWIPSDSFLPRVDGKTYRDLIGAARAANMNMLRVWGGGVYEDEEFYSTCDANGILVWQDFMFACASYPDYKEFVSEVEQEAVENVRRISNHPCAAVFCGNNEAEWIWNMKTGNPVDRMPGAKIFDKILPAIVGKISPEVPYWRSSPFGGETPNSQSSGNHHQWEVWSAFKPPSEYLNDTARFVTEFGFQAPPAIGTISDFTRPEDRNMQSKVMRHHNKQVEGTERLFRFLTGEVKIADDFEDVVLQMQLVQAKAIRTGVEHWRARKWMTAGTLYWQLNDCWPVSSWSAIDSNKKPKALYYWSKKFFKPVKIVIVNRQGEVSVHLVNDTHGSIDGELTLSAVNTNGDVKWSRTRKILGKPNVALKIEKLDLSGLDRENDFISASLRDRKTGTILDEEQIVLVPWLDFGFQKPKIEVSLSEQAAGKDIALTSDKFVQGIYLPLDERIGELSDNFFTLLPGQKKVVEYGGTSQLNDLIPRCPLVL
jgi:beta-mannosidase